MAALEEVILIPESHHHHNSTERRVGLCVVIGAVVLGLVSGLSTGGLFGLMIDETMFHVKDLPPVKDKGLIRDFLTLLLSTTGFLFVTMSTSIGIGLGYGAYSFLISIKGQQAKSTAIAGAAPTALLGITACGATIGVVSVLEIAPGIPAWLAVMPYFFLLCCVSIALCWECCCSVFLFTILVFSLYWFVPYAAIFMFFVGFSGMSFHFFALVSTLYGYVYFIYEELKLKPLPFVPTVFPILLLLFTMLFFADIGTTTISADEKRLAIIVLTTQLFEAALGQLLYLQAGGRGGAGAWKVCLSAVAAGGAVLMAIQKASSLLNTEASLGGLFGVSGAAGVALSAAGELGQRYGDKLNQVWGRKLGRTAALVGAAAGAFLSGGTTNINFGFFKAVCAAMIPGMPFAENILGVFYRALEYIYTRTVMKCQCVSEHGDH